MSEDKQYEADGESVKSSAGEIDAKPPTDVEKGKLESDAKIQEIEDYTVWSLGQRRAIVVAGSFAAWFSPMTGSIYIVQGLAPSMVAGFSDKAGRRPAYFICFAIYIIANLALSLQNNYAALLVLRMVQAAGSSGTVALANGIVGDVTTSAERGSYVAWAAMGTVLGPTLAPVLGGLISQFLDWHWIFWFLLILSIAFAVPFLLFMPETCRNIVGDGSIPPPWTSWNLTDHIRYKRRAKRGVAVDAAKQEALRKNYKIRLPSPMDTFRVLISKEVLPLLLSVGLAMALYYALLTGASSIFANVYGYNQLQVGLIFISIGVGSIISAFTTGRMIDWNYKRYALKLGMPIKRNKQTDLSSFPIERARIEIAMPLLVLTAATIIGYGWMMTQQVSIVGPVIMLFFGGYFMIAGTQCIVVMMVDLYPGSPAASTAAVNIVRCLLGAAASAAIEPMSAALGYGWAYTILCLIFILSLPGLVATARYGIQWRASVKARAERKRALQESQVPVPAT